MATDEHAVHFSGEWMTSGKSAVGSRPLAAESRMRDVHCWKSDAGCPLLEVGCGMSTAGSRILLDGRQPSSARSSCFKYCIRHSYDYISGPSATDRSEDHTRGKLVALV